MQNSICLQRTCCKVVVLKYMYLSILQLLPSVVRLAMELLEDCLVLIVIGEQWTPGNCLVASQ